MAFGKNKGNKNTSAQESAVDKRTPFEIGKNGTVDELREANNKALAKVDHWGDHTGGEEQLELQRGAVETFKEGHVENLQAIFSRVPEFTIRYMYSTEFASESILSDLTEGSDRPADIITLAMDKIPEDERQAFLDNTLLRAVSNCAGAENFISTLLKMGADVNTGSGDPGLVLINAVQAAQTQAVVELLCKNGASFKDALFLMETKGYEEQSINKLKVYREAITGEPATEERKLQQTMDLLLEEVRKITKYLPQPAEQQAANTNQPVNAETSQEKGVSRGTYPAAFKPN